MSSDHSHTLALSRSHQLLEPLTELYAIARFTISGPISGDYKHKIINQIAGAWVLAPSLLFVFQKSFLGVCWLVREEGVREGCGVVEFRMIVLSGVSLELDDKVRLTVSRIFWTTMSHFNTI